MNKQQTSQISLVMQLNSKVNTLQTKIALLEEENINLINIISSKVKESNNFFDNSVIIKVKESEIIKYKNEINTLENKLENSVDIKEHQMALNECKKLRERVIELEKKSTQFINFKQQNEKLESELESKKKELEDVMKSANNKLYYEKVKYEVGLDNVKDRLKQKINNEKLYLNMYIQNRENEASKLINLQNEKLLFESNCILLKNTDIERQLKETNNQMKLVEFSEGIYKELVEDVIRKNILLEQKVKSKYENQLNEIKALSEIRLKDNEYS